LQNIKRVIKHEHKSIIEINGKLHIWKEIDNKKVINFIPICGEFKSNEAKCSVL